MYLSALGSSRVLWYLGAEETNCAHACKRHVRVRVQAQGGGRGLARGLAGVRVALELTRGAFSTCARMHPRLCTPLVPARVPTHARRASPTPASQSEANSQPNRPTARLPARPTDLEVVGVPDRDRATAGAPDGSPGGGRRHAHDLPGFGASPGSGIGPMDRDGPAGCWVGPCVRLCVFRMRWGSVASGQAASLDSRLMTSSTLSV